MERRSDIGSSERRTIVPHNRNLTVSQRKGIGNGIADPLAERLSALHDDRRRRRIHAPFAHQQQIGATGQQWLQPGDDAAVERGIPAGTIAAGERLGLPFMPFIADEENDCAPCGGRM